MNDPKTPEKQTGAVDEAVETKTTEKTSPTSSEESSALHDNPDYIAPDQMDIMLSDVTSEKLHSRISDELEVSYLSPAENNQSSPLWGLIYGYNKRLLVNCVTRRVSRRVNGPKYSAFNVTFLCDTGSPSSHICAEAMTVLLGKNKNDVLPNTLAVQLADFPFTVEAHLSPSESHYHHVNVIGMDVLTQLKMTMYGKNLSFELSIMEYSM